MDPVAKAALRRFEDGSERNRELAVSLVAAVLARDPDAALALMPYALPVLAERLARSAALGGGPVEPSEELRTSLLRLLTALLHAAEGAAAPYGSDCVELLERGAEDACPEVVVEAAAALSALVGALGRRLGPAAKTLCWAFIPNLTHKRAAVRIATLAALQPTLMAGGHEAILDLTGFRSPNFVPIKAFYGDDLKVNYFGKLATDSSAAVRSAFLAFLGGLMQRLDERNEHEARMLPFVLGALADECAPTQRAAAELLEAFGLQSEKEHELEMRDVLTYYPEEYHTDAGFYSHQPGGGGADALWLLPTLVATRPRLGARLLVSNNFGRMVPGCVAELQAWTTALRPRAAALLRSLLLYAERKAEAHTPTLLPALWTAWGDRDPQLRGLLTDCSRLLGRFVPPSAWLEQLLQRVGDANTDSASRCAALQLLAALLQGAACQAPGGCGAQQALLEAVLCALEDAEVTNCVDLRLRGAALGALGAALRGAAGSAPAAPLRLLTLALRLRTPPPPAAAADPSELRAVAAEALSVLSARLGYPSAEAAVAALRLGLLTAEAEAVARLTPGSAPTPGSAAPGAPLALWAAADTERLVFIATAGSGESAAATATNEELSLLVRIAAGALPAACDSDARSLLQVLQSRLALAHGEGGRGDAFAVAADLAAVAAGRALGRQGGSAAMRHAALAVATAAMQAGATLPVAAVCAAVSDEDSGVRAAALATLLVAELPAAAMVAASEAACVALDDAHDSVRLKAAQLLRAAAPSLSHYPAALERARACAAAPHHRAEGACPEVSEALVHAEASLALADANKNVADSPEDEGGLPAQQQAQVQAPVAAGAGEPDADKAEELFSLD